METSSGKNDARNGEKRKKNIEEMEEHRNEKAHSPLLYD